jgi:hypothetical protein
LANSINANAEDVFMNVLTGGKVDFSFHLRFEYKEDDRTTLMDDEASASTARTILVY